MERRAAGSLPKENSHLEAVVVVLGLVDGAPGVCLRCLRREGPSGKSSASSES